MIKKRWLIALLLAFLAIPAVAVLHEESLKQTLRVLLDELKQTAETRRVNSGEKMVRQQHERMVDQVERCNELSIILYSQPVGNTFELTYALNCASDLYKEFQDQKLPFDEIISSEQQEYNRYRRLAQALSKIPPEREDIALPVLTFEDSTGVVIDSILLSIPTFAVADTSVVMDAEATALRDSCLFYTDNLIESYFNIIQKIERDSGYYQETEALIKEAYDYAQDRYQVVQRQVFLEGARDYFTVMSRWGSYFSRAMNELKARYFTPNSNSVWKGNIVWAFAFMSILLLILAIILANLIVRLTIRWVPLFQKPVFQENRKMIISLIGILVFIILLVVGMDKDKDDFISMASRIMVEFAALLGAIMLSIFIRVDRALHKIAMDAYLPVLILAFLVIFFRIIFIPDSVLNLVFPLLTLTFAIWQLVVCFWKAKTLPNVDKAMLWATFIVMASSVVVSWTGLVMMSLLVLTWWFFQLMFLQLIGTVSSMLDRWNQKSIVQRKLEYRKKHPEIPVSADKGAYIEVTWAYDLIKMLVLPVLGIVSVPQSVLLACRVFNLSHVTVEFFVNPLVNISGVLSLSVVKLVIVLSLFFVFRYVIYALKSIYRVVKTRLAVEKMKDPALFKESDINVNLANNVISLLGWGIYVIAAFVMLEIPTSALTIITTGLATGIGFAMKDVLNNFFYGVQLMGGRVRVGDTIECDGIRGKVESLSYQSTHVAAEDGSIIAFTNSALFNKNFKNITRNHQYELVKILVPVKYGTDFEKARQVIMDAMKPLFVKDKYDREVVDLKRGINIRFDTFGGDYVGIAIVCFASVDAHYSFPAAAKEAIYNAFELNDIEIPLPKRELYIKEMPEK